MVKLNHYGLKLDMHRPSNFAIGRCFGKLVLRNVSDFLRSLFVNFD